MLALAISVLFTLTGIAAVLTIADSLLKARTAYARLVLEGELMLADAAASQPAAQAVRLRPAQRRITADRRPAQPLRMARLLPHPVCAAA